MSSYTQKLTLCFSLMSCIIGSCLDKDKLIQLGLTPSKKPHLFEANSVCKQSYSIHKSCVDHKSFEKFVHTKLNFSFQSESHKYSYLQEELENVVNRFKSLTQQISLENTYNGKPVSEEAHNKLKAAFIMIPMDIDELRKQIFRSSKTCFAAQSQIAIGSLCLLSSEAASDFVTASTHTFGVKHPRKLSTNSEDNEKSFAVKVTPESAKEVFNACLPLIRGSCIYRAINESLNFLDGKQSSEELAYCGSEVTECYNFPENCKSGYKKQIIENFFKPFANQLVDREEIGEVHTNLRLKINNFWDQTVGKVLGTYRYLTNLTSEHYSKFSNMTSDGYSKLYGYWSGNYWDSKKNQVRQDFGLFHDNSGVLMNQGNITFLVADDGRDVVADGIAAGKYVRNSPMVPAILGLAFILAQMFV